MLNEAINNREHETFTTSTRKKEQSVSMESFKSSRYVIKRNTSDILMSQTNHHMDDYQSSRTEKIKEHQEMDSYPTKELVKHHMTNRHDNQCSLLQSKRKKITEVSTYGLQNYTRELENDSHHIIDIDTLSHIVIRRIIHC